MISSEELKILKSFAARIPPNDPGAHNNLAIVYYNKGLYDEAIGELEEALKIDTNFVLARNNLDIILKKTGRLELQVERLVRSIDKEPYDEHRTLELADTYRKLSKYSQAIIFYKKVLDYNPGSFEGHFGLGMTLKLLGKYDDALEEVKRALEIKIAPDVYRILGEVYFNKGVIDLAINNFQEAINLEPSSAEGHFLLGFAYGEKGMAKESIEAVKKAIALNPALAQFEPNLPIDIKDHRGHWEFLKEQLGMPRQTENEFQVHYNLGMTYRNKGFFEESRREFEECLRLDNTRPELYLVLGQVSLFLNKLDDASHYLEKAYEQDFDCAACTNAIGVLGCLRNEHDQAAEWFEKTLTLQEDYAPAYNNLGICRYSTSDIEKAIDMYSKGMASGSVDARINLGMHFLQQGNYDEALKMFTGSTADEYFGQGLAYTEIGKEGEAMEAFKSALAISPSHAGSYYNLGFILTKQGKFKEGLDYIRKGMEIEPNYEKKKFRLCVDPQLSGFGPYYASSVQEKRRAGTRGVSQKKEIFDARDALTSAAEYYDNGDFENAIALLDQVLRLQPEWDQALALRAKALHAIGKTEEALQHLQDSIKSQPQSHRLKEVLGTILVSDKRFADARKIYTELLEDEPQNIHYCAVQAGICYNLDLLDEALSLYERLYRMQRDSIPANLGFLKIYVKTKEFDRALPCLEFLQKNHPEVYEFNVLAGQYYYETNEKEKACQYFEKAIQLDSAKPLPYYHLGLLQVQQGDFEIACDSWKKALLLSPREELTNKIKHCLKITVELSEFIKKEV